MTQIKEMTLPVASPIEPLTHISSLGSVSDFQLLSQLKELTFIPDVGEISPVTLEDTAE